MSGIKWSRDEVEQSIQNLVKVLEDETSRSSAVVTGDDMRKVVTPSIDKGKLLHWQVEHHRNKNSGESTLYLVHPPVIMKSSFGNVQEPKDVDQAMRQECETCYDLEDETILLDPDCDKTTTITKTSNSNENESISREKIMEQSQWYFSVVYSDTWQVPLLYFTVQWWNDAKNGSPCTRSEVLDLLNFDNSNNNTNGMKNDNDNNDNNYDSWDFISQEEHPITGIPSFFLHPCQTEDRLALIRDSSILSPTKHENTAHENDVAATHRTTGSNRSYLCDGSILWSWMSMILPSVNCPISSSYFRLVQEQIEKAAYENIK